jgi:hypothetical protein
MSDPHTPTGRDRPEHERVAALVRAVDVRAPETLHRRVQEMVSSHHASRRRARGGALGGAPSGAQGGARSGAQGGARSGAQGGAQRGVLGGRLRPTLAAMAVAAVAGAAVALLTGGAQRPQGPSVSDASRLTLSAATMGAPGESRAHATQLDVAVDGVAFPYWEERFGWRTTGARTDTIGGRRVTTVFYSTSHGARRIGYAIVSGAPAPATSGGTLVWRRGVPYRLWLLGGVPVVTWQRHGRLCVLSGRSVSGAALVRLASWSEGGTAA